MRALAALPLLSLAGLGPAAACALALGTPGTLALSADGTRLASSEGGVAATFTVLNLALDNATVTVSAPQIVQSPTGFNLGAASAEVAYSGAGLLGSVRQAYTASQTSFDVPGLLSVAALMRIDNRIVSAAGFAAGSYQTRTVVTCS
jgi:hypothetical protein